MPREVDWLAREICQEAGYNPDQLVILICQDRDFDYLCLGLAPVEIMQIQPIFMKFIHAAQQKLKKRGPTRKRSRTVASSA